MNQAKLPEKAWAFLVVSDPGQADTLENQAAWSRQAAVANGWVLERTISGVSSGKHGARKLALSTLDELAAMPQSERPVRLLMIRLERLGRGSGLEAIEVFLRLRHLGIIVHTRLDGDVSYDRASELLMPVLRFFIGGMENEVRRDKLNATYARKRKAKEDDSTVAVSNRAPYGLCVRNGHLIAQPPEDASVRLAYDLKVQGYGNHSIAKRLANIAPPRLTARGGLQPQVWRADRVSKLIRNPSYRSTLVSEDTWLLAQRPAGRPNRPSRRYEYALGGALNCECGLGLVGVRGTGKASSAFRYYQCKNFQLHGRLKHYRSDLLEQQFIAILDRLALNDDLIDRYLASRVVGDASISEGQLAAAEMELRSIEGRRRKIYRAFEDDALDQADLRWRLDDLSTEESTLKERQAGLERELRSLRVSQTSRDDVRKLVSAAAARWASANTDDRRALAKAVGHAFGGLIVSGHSRLVLGLDIPADTESLKREVAATSPVGDSANLSLGDRMKRVFEWLGPSFAGADLIGNAIPQAEDASCPSHRLHLRECLIRRSRGRRAVAEVYTVTETGVSRVDFISVARDLHVYQFVTEMDRPEDVQLLAQAYSTVCDHLTVVLEGKLEASYVRSIPSWWGIYQFRGSARNGHYKLVRGSSRNLSTGISAFLRLFSNAELRSLLQIQRIYHPPELDGDALRVLAAKYVAASSVHAWGLRILKVQIADESA